MFGELSNPNRAASNFRKPPVHTARRLRLAVSKQTLASLRSPTRMESARVTVPFGTRSVEARNWPTSVRLQRLSIQSFSCCDSGSLAKILGVPAPEPGLVGGAPSLEPVEGAGAPA